MSVEVGSWGAAYLTKNNIVIGDSASPYESYYETEGERDLRERLTGAYLDGAVVTDAVADALDTGSTTLNVAGGANASTVVTVALPEDASGTFTLQLDRLGTKDATTTTAAITDSGAGPTAQAVQDAISATAAFANDEVVVTKLTNRKVYLLSYTGSAAVDLAANANATLTYTETGRRADIP